jgi:hypothetical protein
LALEAPRRDLTPPPKPRLLSRQPLRPWQRPNWTKAPFKIWKMIELAKLPHAIFMDREA